MARGEVPPNTKQTQSDAQIAKETAEAQKPQEASHLPICKQRESNVNPMSDSKTKGQGSLQENSVVRSQSNTDVFEAKDKSPPDQARTKTQAEKKRIKTEGENSASQFSNERIKDSLSKMSSKRSKDQWLKI